METAKESPHTPAADALRRAVIDVGTNSVKLLVGDVSQGTVTPVWETSQQTRLGQGFYETHQLRPEAIRRTVEAVAQFQSEARKKGAITVRIIATSAARDARNAAELTLGIEQATGVKVEVISGAQEADWAFLGVTSSPGFHEIPLLILDVGGGSTEFILGRGRHQTFRDSFHVGSVRLLERQHPSDPPTPAELKNCRDWLSNFLEREVDSKLMPAFKSFGNQGITLIGTGGTASILAKMHHQLPDYDREIIESTCLSREAVRQRLESLWSVSLADRRNVIGLPPERADVILTGVAVYEAVMNRFGLSELRISTRGLRFGALMSA